MTTAILSEMLDLLQQQTEAVLAGNSNALLQGALNHERLLADLEAMPLQKGPSERIKWKELILAIEREKAMLQSLLTAESQRVDFLLRLIFSNGTETATGYPVGGWRPEEKARVLNRRA